jgi:hypothetical protein
VNKWIEHLTDRNMDLVSKDEFINDVANIKGFSKMLQSWVILESLFIFLYKIIYIRSLLNLTMLSIKSHY